MREIHAAIRHFIAIIDGRMPISGGMVALRRRLDCDGFVSADLNDDMFTGIDIDVSTVGIQSVEIHMDSWDHDDATTFLAAMKPPMFPAAVGEGIKWAAENPDAQRQYMIVICDPAHLRRHGGHAKLIVLNAGSQGERNAYAVDQHTHFRRGTRILALCKGAASGI